MQLPNWKPIDTVVYKAGNSGLPVPGMNEKQMNVAVIGLVAQINIITGCPIPTDERHLKILEREVKGFLNDHKEFSTLTVEEILSAFRFNAAGKFDERIRHYQNAFNLEYLGEVLFKWIPIRNAVKTKADRALIMKHIFDISQKEDLQEHEIIEQAREIWNCTEDFMQIEVRIYDILERTGQIQLSNAEKGIISEKAKTKTYQLERQYYSLFSYGECESLQHIISRKIAVAEFFSGRSIVIDPNASFISAPRPNIGKNI